MANELTGYVEELREAFGAVTTVTAPSGENFFRIESVKLPKGCKPTTTPALLVVNGGARPLFYVKPGVKLSNGADPTSTGAVQAHGEAWLQFSFTFPWDWSTHTLVQFVGASLQRFAQSR